MFNCFKIASEIRTFDKNVFLSSYEKEIPVYENSTQSVFVGDSQWQVTVMFIDYNRDKNVYKGKVYFNLINGNMKNHANVSIKLSYINNWNINNYLLMPGAVYAGNRHRALNMKYPPFITEEMGRNVDSEIIIGDIPRLSLDSGKSEINLRSGDMSTPAVCVYEPDNEKAFILLGMHDTPFGYSGFEVSESDDRKSADIRYCVPAVRTRKYTMLDTNTPSDDLGCLFKEGDCVELPFEIHNFSCKNVSGLFDKFFELRKNTKEDRSYANVNSYSHLVETYNKKYLEKNWNEQEQYYRSGICDNMYQDWQSGWTGGGMCTYSLYKTGDEAQRERVIKTLDCIFDKFQADNGFFYGVYYNKKFYGDDFANPEDTRVLMSRKQADLLYFLLKQYNEFGNGNVKYYNGIKKGCEALARIFEKYGQFGQFIDIEKEEIMIGNTASAGVAPAMFMLAYNIYKDERYKDIACRSAELFYNDYLKKGIVNGGPGEIAQCSDSESSFGLVESYVVLYENTNDLKWLEMAKEATKLFATWVVSYNFNFPSYSQFDKLKIKSIGSVIANAQNKHSAPGIATMSGDSLFKLYRMTGDEKYLELAADIAHNITQYTSTEDRPIYSVDSQLLPPGYSCERVNMSDWEGADWIGAVWCGSCCWCETSMMLTYIEFPGVYVDKKKHIICEFDNVLARFITDNEIEIENIFAYDISVSVFIEDDGKFSDNVIVPAKGKKVINV